MKSNTYTKKNTIIGINFIICACLYGYIIYISNININDDFIVDIFGNNIFRVLFIFLIVGIGLGYEFGGIGSFTLAILLSIAYVISIQYTNFNKSILNEKFSGYNKLDTNYSKYRTIKKNKKKQICGPYQNINSKFNPSSNEQCNSLLGLNRLNNDHINYPSTISQTACKLNLR